MIIDITTSKLNSERRIQSSSTASVVSHSGSDVSSISNDSDSEQPYGISSMNEDISPMPLSEIIKGDDCPQTGDCLDFEGRSYFFVDEEEIESTSRNSQNNISTLLPGSFMQTSKQITLCPSSVAGIALYREFFSMDAMMPGIGALRT